MKILIFDSGTLINLSMNGMLDLLERLKSIWNGKLIITSQVKYEIIDRPLEVERFELGALRVQSLLFHNVLEMPSSLGVNDNEISELTKLFMEQANHSLQVNDHWIPVVSEAEMSCLALSSILSKKRYETLIAVDERTTRILCEKPRELEKLISARTHQNVKLASTDLSLFASFRFIRSSELVYVAFKKGILGLEGKKALEAALYATKFKGAAISFEEIEQLKKL